MSDNFSKRDFWDYISNNFSKIGCKLLCQTFKLYYCMKDKKTPGWAKAVIAGALAYLILPTDLIPDFIVPYGFTDDAAVIAKAFFAVSSHVSDSHTKKARKSLKGFFESCECD